MEMAGEVKEGDVFFADGIEDADGGLSGAGEADDGAAGAAELALERVDVLCRGVEVLLEEPLENVHEGLSGNCPGCFTHDTDRGEWRARRVERGRGLRL